MKSFKYSRKTTVLKKDEEGKPIPKIKELLDHEGNRIQEPIPGQFETEDKWLEDRINLDYYIRTHALEDGRVIVLLDDGHEVTEKVPSLKNKNGRPVPGNIIEEKQRQWVQSEILIAKPEEIEKLYQVLDSN